MQILVESDVMRSHHYIDELKFKLESEIKWETF
jgi:hypothetical protein